MAQTVDFFFFSRSGEGRAPGMLGALEEPSYGGLERLGGWGIGEDGGRGAGGGRAGEG